VARLHGPVREALERSEVIQKIDLKNMRSRLLGSIVEYLALGPGALSSKTGGSVARDRILRDQLMKVPQMSQPEPG
jgi:hypothetical protein